MARRFTAALLTAAVTLASLSGCPKGSEALVPKTRKGWAIAFIIVGASWIVVGAAAALSPGSEDEDEQRRVGNRAVTALGATAIGSVLIGAGWALYPSGDDKHGPRPPTQPYPSPPPPQPYPQPPAPSAPPEK